MSCSDLTTWQGTWIVVPAMATRHHDPITPLLEHWSYLSVLHQPIKTFYSISISGFHFHNWNEYLYIFRLSGWINALYMYPQILTKIECYFKICGAKWIVWKINFLLFLTKAWYFFKTRIGNFYSQIVTALFGVQIFMSFCIYFWEKTSFCVFLYIRLSVEKDFVCCVTDAIFVFCGVGFSEYVWVTS